ncbi:MAG: phospho-N-acetylmuramoyl-pentapeptide-transferase, partial [Cyclobacteriaceae bacterium]
MLYYLFDFLDREYDLIGAGVFQFITFRAGMAAFFSLVITILFGKRLIDILRRKQVGETIRDLGLRGQMEKKGTPTMGGIIIIAAVVVPVLLFARLDNIYIILMLVSVLWMGLVGFLDDYIKVFKKNKEGLAGKFKIVGQVGLGLIVGFTLYFHDDVVVREFSDPVTVDEGEIVATIDYEDVKSSKTTLPFLKDNEFDYSFIPFIPDDYTWVVYVLAVIFIITAVS